MNKKVRIISVSILAILSIAALFLIFNNNNEKGNIDNVERIINKENGHKREDIEETFDMMEKMFNTKDYKGCKLNKIIYPVKVQEVGVDEEESYKKQYNAEEVICLEVEFTTNSRPATGFVANETYNDRAKFAKINGKWILKEIGQG